jgi:hypothetical protein
LSYCQYTIRAARGGRTASPVHWINNEPR